MATPVFIETPRFPDDIAEGSAGGPMFKTYIFKGNSAIEQRNKNWPFPQMEWNISKGIRDRDQMDIMRDWFYILGGRASGFRFKDWRDFSMTTEVIGTGDGIVDTFNITKTYTVGAYTYVRRIYKPVVGSYSVYVNAVLQTEGVGVTEYQLDTTTGIITFGSSAIPPVSEDVTITCEFDVPCRLDIDHMNTAEEGYENETWSSIPVIELILD